MKLTELESWRTKAHQLKREVFALYLAVRDPRTPWYAKVVALCVAGYAFSPIDLIPDPVPVLGYLDDLVLLPMGILLALKLIPGEVMSECRTMADTTFNSRRSIGWIAAVVIIGIWFLAGVLLLRWGYFLLWR